jgi:hypothetical protein
MLEPMLAPNGKPMALTAASLAVSGAITAASLTASANVTAARLIASERGTAAAPAISIEKSGDDVKGLHGNASTAQLGVATGGTNRLIVNSTIQVDANLEMQSARRVLLDTATSLTLTPLGFRGDDGEGIAYASLGSWRTVAGGAQNQTYAIGSYSQNGLATISTTTLVGSVFIGAGTGVISPAALSGDEAYYQPTGFSTCSVVRIDPGGAARIIRSLNASTASRRVWLLNIGDTAAETLTLTELDALGTAGGKFNTPNLDGHVIPAGGGIELYYDAAGSWRILHS